MLLRRSASTSAARPRDHSLKSPSTIFGRARAGRGPRPPAAAPGTGARAAPCRGARCRPGATRPSPRSIATRWLQRGSQVFHDRSSCACSRIGNRLSTTLPNWCRRSSRVGAITQPMPSAAPSSLGVAGAGQPGPDRLPAARRCPASIVASTAAMRSGRVAPIQAAAAVDVVGRDAQVDVIARRRRHPGIIAAGRTRRAVRDGQAAEPSTKSRARAVSRRS